MFIEKKVKCNICGKTFSKRMTAKKIISNTYSNTCQACWDKTAAFFTKKVLK